MKTTTTEKYTLITAETSFESFIAALKNSFNSLKELNIIVDLSAITPTEEEISSLAEFAEIQLENNQSFVVIVSSFDADAFEEELNVVPTLVEAEDMVDMDEMTRDLGF